MGRTDGLPRTRRVRSFRISLFQQDHVRYMRWARKGTLAVLDQGLFSGSNFVVSVLLARWMSESDYGAYSVAYSIFLLVSGFYNVLLLEPMAVFGAVQHLGRFVAYFRQLSQLHMRGGVFTSAGLLIVAGVTYGYTPDSALVGAFLGLSLGHSLILFFWLTRRACYVHGQAGRALGGTLLYSVFLLIGTAILHQLHILTSLSILVWNGIAGVAAGMLLVHLLRKDHLALASLLVSRDVLRQNWVYGRWLLFSAALYWLSGNAYFVVTGTLLSLEDVAALKALQNLINPVLQILMAMNLLFFPWAARRYDQHGAGTLMRDLGVFTVLLVGFSTMFLLLMIVLGKPVFVLLYNDRFADSRWLLPGMALIPVLTSVISIWIMGLKIIGKTLFVPIVDAVGAVVTLTAGLWLVTTYALKGAVGGLILSAGLRIPVLLLMGMWLIYTARKRIAENL